MQMLENGCWCRVNDVFIRTPGDLRAINCCAVLFINHDDYANKGVTVTDRYNDEHSIFIPPQSFSTITSFTGHPVRKEDRTYCAW